MSSFESGKRTVSKPIEIRNMTAVAAIALLARAFPKCFFILETRRVPLKVGIRADIIAKLGAEPTALQIALQFYTHNKIYLKKLVAGAQRFDLAGEPAGIVTADQEAQAKEILARRLLKRKQARQPEAQP
jgi:ProP effector